MIVGRSKSKFFALWSIVLCSYATGTIISESNARLPMSLSTVISDLEAEGISELTTACLISSRGVTQLQKSELIEKIVGTTSDSDPISGSYAFGTDNGLAVAQPPTSAIHQVASTAVACGGTIIYYPSPEDLSRGEGLFESLAPAMERILLTKKKALQQQSQGGAEESKRKATCLIVVVDEDVEATRPKLEQACEPVLSNLISDDKKISVLEDVFDSVLYVAPANVVETLTTQVEKSYSTPAEAAAAVAASVFSDLPTSSRSIGADATPKDLAAARKLGPVAKKLLASALQTVKDATTETSSPEGEATSKLLANFGSLCDAAISRVMRELEQEAASCGSGALLSSVFGKQIRENLQNELLEDLGDLFEEQLDLLQAASFEEFQKDLSRLRVSPNLGTDMDDVVSKSLSSFAAAAKKLQAKKASWSFSYMKSKFRRMLKDYCVERLQAARASGQYKPLPRKGVTVGFHWLLPKPFGNDFRQEPWMVHATDNMVYIPQGKISDVSADEVVAGDWRSKIVPSPAGNNFIYMQ